jgi:hypothetical protein
MNDPNAAIAQASDSILPVDVKKARCYYCGVHSGWVQIPGLSTATSIFSMVKNQDLRRNKLDLERLYGLLNRFGEGGGVSSTAPVRRRPDCDISQQVSPHSIDGLEPIAENPCFFNVFILRRISEDAGLHHSDPYFFSGTLTAYMAGLIEAR